MASMRLSSLLILLFLSGPTLALQVSSKSPCTSLCLDASQNTTSSSSSSSMTLGSDISCLDSDYAATTSGRKFMSCVSCLQTSTASDENGSDQRWFLYNLRFALNSCLFGFQQPSDSVSSPCLTSASCGPLQLAFGNGNLVPSNESEYSYCSAGNDAILGSSLDLCKDCLSSTQDEKYLRNFLTALQAGCDQKPPTGVLIGLEGSVFSTAVVNVTYPGYNQISTSASKATHKSGLTQGAIIGIAVGLAVLFLVAIAILIIYARKRRNWNRQRKQLNSPLHSRFGAPNITAPTNGAYGNPYAPPTAVNQPFDSSEYTVKELTVLDSARAVLGQHQSPIDLKDPQGWYNNRLARQLSNPPGPAIPTHQAYIPTSFSPISPSSPTVSDATSDTYHIKEDRSSRSSPKYTPKHTPPPLILAPKPPLHRRSPSMQVQRQIPEMRAIDSTQGFPPSPPQAIYEPQSQSQPRYERDRSLSRPRAESRTRDESRPRNESRTRADSLADGHAQSRTRVESRSGSRTRNDGRAQSKTREESRDRLEDFPRISPPGLHSQRMGFDEQGPNRSASRADNYKRTTVRPGISNTNASNDAPFVRRGGRFDFELAERERLEKERTEAFASITKDSFKKKKAKPEDATPVSAESAEEQWPGSY